MKHLAKKRFGQNFLVDETVVDRILQALNPKENQNIIEIGPGCGALTKPLLEKNLSLDVIEIDRDLILSLEALKKIYPKLSIHTQDVLQYDFSEKEKKYWRIIGNLPYNISSPILLHCFKFLDYIVDMHFMLQKEVVDRLCAAPNTKDYGRLSVITQYFCKVQKLFEVPKESFDPTPKVTSAVFRLTPKENHEKISLDVKKLELVTQHAFGQRRKTLRHSLEKIFTVEKLLALGIDPKRRAETLTLEEFCLLAQQTQSK